MNEMYMYEIIKNVYMLKKIGYLDRYIYNTWMKPENIETNFQFIVIAVLLLFLLADKFFETQVLDLISFLKLLINLTISMR